RRPGRPAARRLRLLRCRRPLAGAAGQLLALGARHLLELVLAHRTHHALRGALEALAALGGERRARRHLLLLRPCLRHGRAHWAGCEMPLNALPAFAGWCSVAMSPSETMPTSRLSRSTTGSRRICCSAMLSTMWFTSSSSKQYLTSWVI